MDNRSIDESDKYGCTHAWKTIDMCKGRRIWAYMLLFFYSLATLCIVSALAWTALRNHIINTTTVIPQLRLLHPKRNRKKVQGTAVVAGGSIAGYATARVLSDHFARVVIIEPDYRIKRTATRVAQRGHPHFPMPMMILICRALYSDFDEVAAKMGCKVHSPFRRLIVGTFCNWRTTTATPSLEYQRVELEKTLRKLAASYAGDSLEVIQGTVTRLHASPRPLSASISAVSYKASMKSSETVTIPCVFFADCSGASAIASKLLPEAIVNYSEAGSTEAAMGLQWGPYTRHSYVPKVMARCFYVPVKDEKLKQRIADLLPRNDPNWGNWNELRTLHFQSPGIDMDGSGGGPKEGIIIQKVLDNELLISYSGLGDVTMPRNLAQLDLVVRDAHEELFKLNPSLKDISLWVYALFDLLQESQVDDEIQILSASAKMYSSWYIDYLSAPTPNNFVAIGDSAMCVNPIFSQGMMKALQNAVMLNTTLHKHITGFTTDTDATLLPISRSYFALANQVCLHMYIFNRMFDYGYPTTKPQEGETLEYGARFRVYWKYLNRASQKSTMVANVLEEALGGLRPGLDLFSPLVVGRVLWEWFQG
ncbi:uncharacterized protein EI90DRAFT_3122737 [Cantharellus anzutake]|uniref:uncharacterized protein n=1 Tax=Cantharellus anzutake TaxID=1750568 RepID=UPI001908EB02|nr:uncharacterized protein EI90DRAFT_3122737 [Cantharellus anzutake]KAF8332304.1 hypothetical protein EI90DRAFT_3122737 [Cantharellus anzutake]